MEEKLVIYHQYENGVVLVTLNRPQARNALNLRLRQQLAELFNQFNADSTVRAIVLTGGEEVFAAGADLNDFLTAKTVDMYIRHTEYYWQAISQCHKPIIAAVNGYALGGGCELAMHADIIVAGESAKFGQPEVKLSLMPGAGGTQRLFRTVGKYKAMKMLLTGEIIDATTAYNFGLVSEVVADNETLNTALKMAQKISQFSPIALTQIKEVAMLGIDMPLDGALALERKALYILFDTQDQKEGVKAFFEKRPANYIGK